MAEITGDTPQAVALRLMELIGFSEKKSLGTATTTADRQWILDTYKECINSVLDVRRWGAYGD